MLLTVRQFIQQAHEAMPSLVKELQEETGRFGEEEASAWTSSLAKVAQVFESADLGDFHLQLNGRTGNVALEYRLPAASSWCDLVVLGRGASAPSAVMVELKHWDTAGDQPGPRPGLIRHKGILELHPSEQVRGYVEYCRRFHSEVVEQRAEVAGCSFFTQAHHAAAYVKPPHSELTREYPVFTASPAHLLIDLPAFLRQHLRKPAPGFARLFTEGTYRQDRDFVRTLATTLVDPSQGLVLLDHQRKGFELCLDAAEDLLETDTGKAVVLVEGPPGSGKSAVAARLWAELARREDLDGNFVFVTTSSSQKRNWEAVFEKHGRGPAAKGVIKTANAFNPGLDSAWVGQQKKAGKPLQMAEWKRNIALWAKRSGKTPRIPDDSIAVSIVDEAHALIDPTVPGGAGNKHSGWSFHAGPQAWHILRASRLTVFFLDPEQSFRDNETTTEESIEAFARDHGATVLPKISLAGAQFRCAGSREYVEWIDRLFEDGGLPPARPWRPRDDKPGFEFEMVGDPGELDERLAVQAKVGRTVRLLSAYGREWKTKGQSDPHRLTHGEKDFCIPYWREGKKKTWSKVWNYCPDSDYSLFVQAPEGSPMAADVLSEVGCPYVVRGFDYDYVGLVWLSDLVWRQDHWEVQLEHVFESAWTKTLAAAKREKKAGTRGPAHAELVSRSVRGYRILLTRPIRGLYLWCEDAETREHLRRALADA